MLRTKLNALEPRIARAPELVNYQFTDQSSSLRFWLSSDPPGGGGAKKLANGKKNPWFYEKSAGDTKGAKRS